MMSFRQWAVLLGVYVVYMLVGAVVFVALEVYNEMDEREDLYHLKQRVIEVVLGLDNSSRGEVEEVLVEIGEECGHDFLSTSQDEPLTWSLWNSFFFSFTVITTIGFGHMAPKTQWGRVVCIAYATLGVPLNGILIAVLADIFSGKIIKWDVRKWAERYKSCVKVAVDAVIYLVPGLLVFLVLPSVVIMFVEEGWDYLDSFYYAFITLTTIGFGDHVAGRQEEDLVWVWLYKVISVVWIIFGLGYIIMIITFIQKALKSKHIHNVERKMASVLKKHAGKFNENLHRDLKKVRTVVTRDSKRVHPEVRREEEGDVVEGKKLSTILPYPPPLPSPPTTPTHRHRSSSESDLAHIEKGGCRREGGWSLDEVLELVERLLSEEEAHATQDLQARLLYHLHYGLVKSEGEEGEITGVEGDLETGEVEGSGMDLQKDGKERGCRWIGRRNERPKNEEDKLKKGQDGKNNDGIENGDGGKTALGWYLNQCYEDDDGNNNLSSLPDHAHPYHSVPARIRPLHATTKPPSLFTHLHPPPEISTTHTSPTPITTHSLLKVPNQRRPHHNNNKNNHNHNNDQDSNNSQQPTDTRQPGHEFTKL